MLKNQLSLTLLKQVIDRIYQVGEPADLQVKFTTQGKFVWTYSKRDVVPEEVGRPNTGSCR